MYAKYCPIILLYKVPVKEYKNLLKTNITSEYKKSSVDMVAKINKEASKIAKKLDIDNRVDKYIESNAFITLKDHKPEFMSRLPCRLINPAKSNLGKVSKVILENMVRQIRTKTGSNQWKNSQDVIEWFSNLEDKKSLVFFKFDINSFYPSISETLFNEAINWSVN